jgi:hypothetical protein
MVTMSRMTIRNNGRKEIVDTLKVVFRIVDTDLNEVELIRTSTNSRDPKSYKFYFSDHDMFELQETITLYNEGLKHE